MSHQETEKVLAELKIERRTLKGSLTRLQNRVAVLTNEVDSLSTELELVTEINKKYNQVQSKIEKIQWSQVDIDEVAVENEQNLERDKFEKQYVSIVASIKSKGTLSADSNQGPGTSHVIDNSTGTGSNSTPKIALPAVKLPTFAGGYADWVPFRDTFKSVIHENVSLSNIEKFHYLRSSLSGEAMRVVDSLSPISTNYEVAWNLLQKRFENKRLIVMAHVKQILDTPAVNKVHAGSLRHLSDSLLSNIAALKALEIPVEQWDVILIAIISEKLDYQTKKEWQSRLNADVPTLDKLLELIDLRCQILESATQSSGSLNANLKAKGFVNHFSGKRTCPICKHSTHNTFNCNDFLSLSVDERMNKIKANQLCINCLKPHHMVKQCKSNQSCRHCNKKHNTLLHKELVDSISMVVSQTSISSENHTHERKLLQTGEVILSTAVLHVFDQYGYRHTCRALLDGGSQSNFITKELCRKLRLNIERINHTITGVNLTHNEINEMVHVDIESRFSKFQTTLNCLVLNSITQNLPLNSFSTKDLKIPKTINLADETFNINSQIDMLIGAQTFFEILKNGKLNVAPLLLQCTELGWIVSGTINLSDFTTLSGCSVVGTCQNKESLETLHKQVLQFFELEGSNLSWLNPSNKILSADEAFCEYLFSTSHKRTRAGNFVVDLPIKNNESHLGHSELIAKHRFFKLEQKLGKNHKLRADYIQFMREYQNLGHMKQADNQDLTNGYFIPHHAITKNTIEGSKIRVVFDASMKTSNNRSLNDNLLIGPNLQKELFLLLIRFRTYNYVISADIQKMYRNIFLTNEHQKYQKILWRENISEPLKIYQLRTVTYGTAPAPYLAMRCLKQLATENKEKYPIAASNVLNNFYMDDLICGADTVQSALTLRDNIIKILKQGNFALHKWASNDARLLPELDSKLIVNFNDDIETRTLGLVWQCSSDRLKYNLAIKNVAQKPTKRLILSVVSQIFDPLGLITPVILKAKIIMQALWSCKLDWNDTIPDEYIEQWNQFLKKLVDLKEIKIPRKVFRSNNFNNIQVHGFADASNKGFGAAIYIKSISADNRPHTQLLCAKSKVAPVKTITLPRLELSATVLLARLWNKIRLELNLKSSECFLWTDSTIVLHWLKSSPHTWETFVANRVSEIQNLTVGCIWNHVPSADNPADIITRGAFPKQLMENQLWWTGPNWLLNNSKHWPKTVLIKNVEIAEKQQKTVNAVSNVGFKSDLLLKYSNYTKLQRTVAWSTRFIVNCKNKGLTNNYKSGFLSSEELNCANLLIIRLVQQESFNKEINLLKEGKDLAKNNSLLSLNPFVDKSGLMRVGGRIRHSHYSYAIKHPIILPKNHHITNLIIQQYHLNNLHSGNQATLAAVRQRYWPIAGRNAVRSVISKCFNCFKLRPKINVQKMGDLPSQRIEESRPFLKSGVDLCGPIFIKDGHFRKIRSIKAYIALFICLATKAVHIEILTSLTTEGFLNALKRFIARRGTVAELHSDNATNFVGTNKQLMNTVKKLIKGSDMGAKLAINNIKWYFTPPRTPNFGGIWEANIKSAKSHIKRTIGETVLTYEEMLTFLVRVEACLNSRPLIPLSNDPNDLSPLTPGHFLIGAPLTAPLEENLQDTQTNRLSRWQHVEKMRQHFWQRWRREYITQLQRRSKWASAGSELITPGVMVLLVDEAEPPLRWPIGRVQEVHPGSDGVVRVVTVKTAKGVYKRGASKICVLPCQ